MSLPTWASKLAAQYTSHAANQFLLYGNVNDRSLILEPLWSMKGGR